MNMTLWKMTVVAAAMGAIGVSQANTSEYVAKDFTPAVKAFLADHGDLCLAWYTWPRDLTAADQETGMNEAVQLPVLERLGVVQSESLIAPAAANTAAGAVGAESTAPGPEALAHAPPTKRYSLTPTGQKYYLKRKRETLNVHGQTEVHDGDFCVAHLTLDKVIKWSPPDSVGTHLETVVHYTYRIEPAPWMSDPEARKVFPVVDKIIRGAGKLEMTASVKQQDGKWLPVLPGH